MIKSNQCNYRLPEGKGSVLQSSGLSAARNKSALILTGACDRIAAEGGLRRTERLHQVKARCTQTGFATGKRRVYQEGD